MKNERMEFLYKTQERCYENIRFTDRKAAVLLALNLAALAALLRGGYINHAVHTTLLSLGCLALSILTYIIVMLPRGSSSALRGAHGQLFLPYRIDSKYGTDVGRYLADVNKASSQNQLEHQVASAVIWATRTGREKMRLLFLGILVSVVGFLCAMFAVLQAEGIATLPVL